MSIETEEESNFEMLELDGEDKTSLSLVYVYSTKRIELKIINGKKATLYNLDRQEALELVNAITDKLL